MRETNDTIRGREVLQCIEEKEASIVPCYRNNSKILSALKNAVKERPAPSFLPNEKVRVVKKRYMAEEFEKEEIKK